MCSIIRSYSCIQFHLSVQFFETIDSNSNGTPLLVLYSPTVVPLNCSKSHPQQNPPCFVAKTQTRFAVPTYVSFAHLDGISSQPAVVSSSTNLLHRTSRNDSPASYNADRSGWWCSYTYVTSVRTFTKLHKLQTSYPVWNTNGHKHSHPQEISTCLLIFSTFTLLWWSLFYLGTFQWQPSPSRVVAATRWFAFAPAVVKFGERGAKCIISIPGRY